MTDRKKVLKFLEFSTSYQEVREFIANAQTKSEKYSLRADSYIVKNGKQEQIVYALFIRDGSEPFLEKILNWIYADKQRFAARSLLRRVILESNWPVKMEVSRERMLLHLAKMKRIAPDGRLKRMLCDLNSCGVRLARIKEVNLELSDHANVLADLQNEYSHSFVYEGNCHGKDSAEAMIGRAAKNWGRYVAGHFFRFTTNTIRKTSTEDIDYSLVAEFCTKWTESDIHDDDDASFARFIGKKEPQRLSAIRAAVQEINTFLEGKVPNATNAMPIQEKHRELALSVETHAAPVRPGLDNRDSARSPGLLFPYSATRSFFCHLVNACRLVAPLKNAFNARKLEHLIVSKKMLKKPLSGAKPEIRVVNGAALENRKCGYDAGFLNSLSIKNAHCLRDISCDWQSELDIRDVDKNIRVLMRSTPGPCCMSLQCEAWLERLIHAQKKNKTEYKMARSGKQGVILADYQVRPLNSTFSKEQMIGLKKIYRVALNDALAEHKPILLTQLFDYDEAVSERCIKFMLDPIKKAIALGGKPAVHIRVTSKELHGKISAAIKNDRPFMEIREKITEQDLRCAGMIMVTRDTENLFEKAPRNIFSNLYAEYEKKRMEKIVVRNILTEKSSERFYFFSEQLGLNKDGLPQGSRIANEYARFFEAVRRKRCRYATVSLLWLLEDSKYDQILAGQLCAAMINARQKQPDLKMCILSRHKAVTDTIAEQFGNCH